jgi:hypothetical protein
MVRTQIQLTESQARALRQRAHERGVSMAEVIRGFVDQGLAAAVPDRAALYRRAALAIGRWRDRGGARDLAENHDRYLDEAYE